jgi:hypothetical protein
MKEANMAKRIGTVILLVALIGPFAGAQGKRIGKAVTREKPRLATAVTVIDLRNITSDKKPPKRSPAQLALPRMMSVSPANKTLSGLPPAQLNEAFKSAGISAPSANVYARFAPGQLQAAGKGFLYVAAPDFAFPDHIEFHSLYSSEPWDSNGPLVVLREPGTYAFDFLVEFTGGPPGAAFGCQVRIGSQFPQVQTLDAAGGPQHILVIWNLDPAMAALPDEDKAIGIHIYPKLLDRADWTFYLVDVTKL